MKPSNAFKETIKNYLEKRASEDDLFAETFKKTNKSIDECCNYVMKCAKECGATGYADEEVFGWAVHYYDEDDIKNIKPVSGTVIVNQKIELSQEDKEAIKQKGIDLAIEEAKEEAKKTLAETIELNEEDIIEARKLAIAKVVDEQKEKLVQKKTAKKSEVKTEVEQDLFSM